MYIINPIISYIIRNRLIAVVGYLVMLDIIFGTLRAARQRKFNSTIGIDGLIRKAGIVVALFAVTPLDMVLRLNLIGFLPEGVLVILAEYLSIERVGLSELFALLFAAYETVSILKNMYLAGLPVKRLWSAVYKFLNNYTDELPDTEEEEL